MGKSNLFSLQNLRDKQFARDQSLRDTQFGKDKNLNDKQFAKDQVISKKQNIINFAEKKSSKEIRKTISQVDKRIKETKSVLDNFQVIEQETIDKEDGFQRFDEKIHNVGKDDRKGKNSGFQGVNDRNYPNGWAGPKPNCAWDGPGACKRQRNRNKQSKPKEKKFIDTIAAISNFRHEKDNDRESKSFIETKINKAIENLRLEQTTLKNEKTTKEIKKSANVIIEKSRFINLFPKRLKPFDLKDSFSVNQSKESFENPFEKVNKSSDPFDRSNLFPGKTIRERIKENLRQRERERNKHSSLAVETIKPKTKKIITPAVKFQTSTIRTQKQTSTKITKFQKVNQKQKEITKQTTKQTKQTKQKKQKKQKSQKKQKPEKQKEREGRVGSEIWSVKEWLRRG